MPKKPTYEELECQIKTLEKETLEHLRDETAFRQLEETYAGLIEASLTGIYIDQDSKIVFANRRFAEIFGYERKALMGMESWKLVHPDDRALTNERRRRRLHGEPVPSEYEARGVKRDDSIIWIKRRNCRINYQGRPAVLGNVVDITKRKEMERDLKQSTENLRFLSSKLLTAQERERKRISIELHDELGQAMTVLKLQLRAVERKLPESQAALKQDCETILRYVDGIIANVRRLSRDLSPSILEDLGLSAALHCLVEEIGQHCEIATDYRMDDINDLFAHDAQITIYRIFQEILTNVGKHAMARHLYIQVKRKEDRVAFHIRDDGCGFDLKHVRNKEPIEKGLGLAAMDERVRMLKGSLDIRTRPEAGTAIAFTVPVKKG
jgi:PAS domain S-box-containing protein